MARGSSERAEITRAEKEQRGKCHATKGRKDVVGEVNKMRWFDLHVDLSELAVEGDAVEN